MKHVHADKMLLYAQDAQETEKPWVRWERAVSVNTWHAMQMNPAWLPLTMYRRIDEYRECREAQDRGETIEFHGTNGEWVSNTSRFSFEYKADRYRVKKGGEDIVNNAIHFFRDNPDVVKRFNEWLSQKKTVKKYKWVMCKGPDDYFVSNGYYATAHKADLASDECKSVVQRIDSTMIEK